MPIHIDIEYQTVYGDLKEDYLLSTLGPVVLFVDYTDTQFAFKFQAPVTSTLKIHDGDGTVTNVPGNDATSVTHTTNYSNAGSYLFYVEGDVLDITGISVSDMVLTAFNINPLKSLTNLEFITLIHDPGGPTHYEVTGDVDYIASLPNFWSLKASKCGSLTGTLSAIVTAPSLTQVYLDRTLVSGDMSEFDGKAMLTIVVAETTNITFNTAVSFSVSALFIALDANWTSSEVDNALISLAAGSTTGATISLGGNNAARTSASDAAFTQLNAVNTLTVNE